MVKGYARVLRLVGLEHEDLVSMDDPDGKERLDEGRNLIERGKRHDHIVMLRKQASVRSVFGWYHVRSVLLSVLYTILLFET